MDRTVTHKTPRTSIVLAALIISLTTGCSRQPVTVTLTPTSGVIAVGLSQQFTPTGYFSNGKALPLTGAQWSVSRPDLASVSGTGLVTGRTAGTTMLIATVNGFTVQAPVTVTPLAVQSIVLTPNPATIAFGNTLTLTPTVTYTDRRTVTLADGAQAPGSDYHTLWHSDNDAVASVDENGIVTMHQASGSAIISMGLGDVHGEVKVSAAPAIMARIFINVPPHGLPNGDNGSIRLKRGSTLQLHAMGTSTAGLTSELSSGPNAMQPKASWLAEDASIISISPTGLLTAVGEGETRIVLNAGGLESELAVMVE